MEVFATCSPQAAQVGSLAPGDRLWKFFYRDPSPWWGNRKSRTNPRAPDFNHKLAKEPLWMGAHNTRWVKEGMLRLEGTGEPCAIKGMHKAPQEADSNNSISGGGWMMFGLEEALFSLEKGILPQPSIEDFSSILHKCRKERNRTYTLRLHAYMRKCGLEDHVSLGNDLISMLVEVGNMRDAKQVFDQLVYRSASSWNSLITGFIKYGDPKHAFILYQKMQEDDSVQPDGHTFVALLKVCAKLKDLKRGSELHAAIARKGSLEGDLFVGCSLVDMYAKCGSLTKAREVFDKLPVRNIFSWNAIIAGYAKHGFAKEALNCFKQMRSEHVFPNAVTYVCILKACGSIRATEKGRELHSEIVRKGLETDLLVGSTLVDMYAKCGFLVKAQEVFDKLPVRDVVSWNALITGYANHGRGKEALNCFKQMQHEGVSPDAITFICSLKACGMIGAIGKGQEIHVEIDRKGLLQRDIIVGNALIDMYVKCGLLAKAQEVFDKLPVKDVVSWNALISGYAKHEHGEEALNLFKQMQREGISPNAVTFICSLKACGSIGAIDKGQEVHAEIARQGLENDRLVGSTLVDMYAKCGLLAKAQEVFDKLSVRDLVLWTALIAGYCEHGHGEEALNCFEQMQQEGIYPDAVTFLCSLKACGTIGAVDKGREIHTEIARKGLLERDLAVGNALVDMYAKCGSLAKAREVFDKLPVRDVVSWTTLITGYTEHECGEEALNCFQQMDDEGISPDAVTLACSLKACGSIGATDKGLEIHAEIAKRGLETDHLVGSTLVDMYAKCGSFANAREVFDKLPVRDVILWTSLITQYAEHGCSEEALNCFQKMQHEGIYPNALTYVCSLKACASIGATEKGQEIHAEIVRKGLLEKDVVVGNALVDMYANCGWPSKAQEVFDKLSVQDKLSWNALISGYAHLGEIESVSRIFDRMVEKGLKPDLVTFVHVLNTCSHAGLVDKGAAHFEAMIRDYGINPMLEHYTCMINLLGRAGQLDNAVAIIKKMPFRPDLVVWCIVLGACQKWANVELGRQAFEHAVSMGERDGAAYVCMSNIYSDADMQEDAE